MDIISWVERIINSKPNKTPTSVFFLASTCWHMACTRTTPFTPHSVGFEEIQLCLSRSPLPGAIPETPWQELVGLLCYLFFTVSLLKSSRRGQTCFVPHFIGASAPRSDKWIV